MWPFPKTKWIVVKQEMVPSLLEKMLAHGLTKMQYINPSLLRRYAVVHYRDEYSGNEKVEIITL